MRKKLVAILLSTSLCVVSLTGCGSQAEIDALNNMEALNVDSDVSTDYSLSYADEQNAIYAQVIDRTLLDLSTLSKCSDTEVQEVINYMDSVDNQLVGKLYTTQYVDQLDRFKSEDYNQDDEVINNSITDYLLTVFEQTPYYWQRTKTTIRGMEPSSRAVVVDVDYNTIDFKKDVQLDSSIVQGDPDYWTKVYNRAVKYKVVLDNKYTKNTNKSALIARNAFKKHYGDMKKLAEEQKKFSPTSYIYNTGNQQTYNGLIDSAFEELNASCTVRYVLVPKYVLGVNLGLTCSHAYMLNYSLENDPTEGLEVFTDEGYATITDNVYNLIYSYFTCIDESDFNGLYKLTNNFQTLDRYYDDVFKYSYRKHDGFTISLFNVTGTHVTCGVTISTKERPKNSNMTQPIYTDRYFVEIQLKDDALAVNNLVLVDRKLEGEPAVVTQELDTTQGFLASVDLSNQDMIDIEKLICDFSSIQLQGDIKSDAFSKLIDTSITTNQLEQLRANMSSLTGKQKVVFLQSYQQGTSNYASVRCKELYQDSNNEITEVEVVYEFISKGDKWYIYNYDINSSVRLDTTNLQTAGSLCLVSPGKIVSYDSQVTDLNADKENTGENGEDSNATLDDNSVVFTHKTYTPKLKKNGVVQQGSKKITASQVDKSRYSSMTKSIGIPYSFEDFTKMSSKLVGIDSKFKDFGGVVKNTLAVYNNIVESRYSSTELATVRKQTVKQIDNLSSKMTLKLSSKNISEENKVILTDGLEMLSMLSGALEK